VASFPDPVNLADIVKVFRRRTGMNQTELAVQISVSRCWIGAIEHGRIPAPKTIRKLVAVMKAAGAWDLAKHLQRATQLTMRDYASLEWRIVQVEREIQGVRAAVARLEESRESASCA
jgi:DNA-binding XRE family transcriptional regulator